MRENEEIAFYFSSFERCEIMVGKFWFADGNFLLNDFPAFLFNLFFPVFWGGILLDFDGKIIKNELERLSIWLIFLPGFEPRIFEIISVRSISLQVVWKIELILSVFSFGYFFLLKIKKKLPFYAVFYNKTFNKYFNRLNSTKTLI